MNEKTTICMGELVKSLSGHDAGKFFLVVRMDADFVWLCDGKTRKTIHCKRKNRKHIAGTGLICDWVATQPERVNNTSIRKAMKELLSQYGR